MKVKFKRDTSFRKNFFTPESFAHPAKMDSQLLLWIVEKYTKAGENILDPMAGSGTLMLACTIGRNVVLVELEDKFCKMMRDNWERVRMMPQLGYSMGECKIIQGDARSLEGLVDNCIFSPPYTETLKGSGADAARERIAKGKYKGLRPDVWISQGNRAGSTFGDGYSRDPQNIGNLRYGEIDAVIGSPPYGNPRDTTEEYDDKYDLRRPKGVAWGRESFRGRYGESQGQLGNLPYGNIDSIITSPPFTNQLAGGEKVDPDYEYGSQGKYYAPIKNKAIGGSRTPEAVKQRQSSRNIGNINVFGNKGTLCMDSYLSAMLQVYQQCHSVLKDNGLMVLVVKPFIRDKKLVPLQEHTKQICRQAGFIFIEEHHRMLPSQSFWRIIYARRFPDAPEIDKEYVLIFKKGDGP